MRDESLDRWIERWNDGDAEAVGHVLALYEPYLRIAVRRRLGRRLQAKLDSMDVVQSVFATVLDGYRRGGWRFAGREQMRAFLRRIAWRRLADRYQKHKRVLAREQSLNETQSGNLPRSLDPRPSQEAQGQEFWERALQACPPAHRDVLRLRLKGWRIGEIAKRTGLHEGSVRRILYELARQLSIGPRVAIRSDEDTG